MWWLVTESLCQTGILNTLVSTGEVNTQAHAAAHNYQPVQGKREKSVKDKINKGHIKQHATSHGHFYLLFVLKRHKHITWQMPAHSKELFCFFFSVTFASSLYAMSVSACLSICLCVFLSVWTSHIISVYCNSCLCMSYLYRWQNLTWCACVWECNSVRGLCVVEAVVVVMSYLWSAALLLLLSCLVCVDWDFTNLMTVSMSYSDWQKGHRSELLWCSFQDTNHIKWIDRQIERKRKAEVVINYINHL